jgi:hypothetical protein
MTPDNTSVIIDWSDTYSGYATLSVLAAGICGNSPSSAGLPIHLRPFPGTPGTPSGDTQLCQGVTTSEFTVSSVDNANHYTWRILPAAAGTIAGSDTIGTVTWDPAFTGAAEISVKAVNDCNESPYSPALEVTVYVVPVVDLGDDITIPQDETVTLDAGNQGSSYLWSNGEVTQTIIVGYEGNASDTYSVDVTLNNCTGSDEVTVNFTPTGIEGAPATRVIHIIPNPNDGRFRFEISVQGTDEISLSLLNLLGSEVYRRNSIPVTGTYSEEMNFTNQPKGIYYLIIKGRSNQSIHKVVLQR